MPVEHSECEEIRLAAKAENHDGEMHCTAGVALVEPKSADPVFLTPRKSSAASSASVIAIFVAVYRRLGAVPHRANGRK